MNTTFLGLPAGLTATLVVIIAIAVLVAAAEVFASIANTIVSFRYIRYHFNKNTAKMNGEEAANYLLETLGMKDSVKVEKANFFRALIFGNCYSARKKTVFLMRHIMRRNSLVAIATASRLVALAVQDKNGDEKFKRKVRMEKVTWFAPVGFIPLVLVGLVVDLIMTNTVGIVTLVSAVIGFLYFLIAVIMLGLTIPVDKKANADALVLLTQTGVVSETEQKKVKKLFDSMILAEIANFILAVIYLIKMFFKILLAILKISSKK